MTNFWGEKKMELKKIYIKKIQLSFSSKMKLPQLGTAHSSVRARKLKLELITNYIHMPNHNFCFRSLLARLAQFVEMSFTPV